MFNARIGFALLLAVIAGSHHISAAADVVIAQSPPQAIVLNPGRVAVEPFACPQSVPQKACEKYLSPQGNPDNWLTLDDYPPAARRTGRSGTLVLQCSINQKFWRPNACDVIQSSGSELLDRVARDAIWRRARFQPPAKVDGLNARLYGKVRIVWEAPWVEEFQIDDRISTGTGQGR